MITQGDRGEGIFAADDPFDRDGFGGHSGYGGDGAGYASRAGNGYGGGFGDGNGDYDANCCVPTPTVVHLTFNGDLREVIRNRRFFTCSM